MKIPQLFLATIFSVGSLFISSCNDDDTKFESVVVSNSELKNILIQQGYEFDTQGQLIINDKAKNTTSLDLSGTKIADLSDLDILPNLTDIDLSDNEYGPIFDFSALPAQITGVDLTGNNIYDFEGLVDAKVENDEVKTTILHSFKKLYLPESAKWNVEDLMPFYVENKAKSTNVDMQIQGSDGKLQTYTTLREIPDQYFRTYLKTLFASLFPNDGTQIDISKYMSITEQGNNITLWYTSNFADIDKIESLEGIEYFINNSYYKSFQVTIGYEFEQPMSLSYLAPRANIRKLDFSTVSTPMGMDLRKATTLAYFSMGNNEYLTKLDLSNTLVFNQKIEDIEGNGIQVTHCNNLKTIQFPEKAEGVAWTLLLGDLPALEALDLSFIYAAQSIYLLQLPKCNITYPDLKYKYNAAKNELLDLSSENQVFLAISQDVFDLESTKAFITTYRTSLRDKYTTYRNTFGAIRWSSLM